MKLSIKNMTAEQRWVPVLIVIFAAVFRAVLLAIKPPHFDEGINGWFVDQMMHSGYYDYDPANYHGPLHFYILFVFKALFGRNLWALRLPVVILSTLTVWLVTKFDRFMDRRACWLAALAMAVSPGMEFYGRYAIHETDLVFFLILTVWGFAGMWRFGGLQYLWATALGMTGMMLTKETYIIHFTAFALAAPCLWILEKFLPCKDPFPRGENIRYSILSLCSVGAVCAALLILFYSGFLLNPTFYTMTKVPVHLLALHSNFTMPTFLVKTFYEPFTEWVKTGSAGNGHEKLDYDLFTISLAIGKKQIIPPIAINYYWLALMARYEWPAITGMYVSQFYIWPKSNRFIRYLMIYAWGAFTAYSIVRYKTPWCVITIMWPFMFVFGHFFAQWMDMKDAKPLAISVVTVLLSASFAWSVRLSFFHYTDDKEGYVYVQTHPDIYKLTDPLFKLVAKDRSNYHLKGEIFMDSPYPLPWILGDFTNILYYDHDVQSPAAEDMDADFLLVDKDRLDEVQKALKKNYFIEKFDLRNSLDPVRLYLNYDKFHDLFPGRKAEFIQGMPAPPDDDNSGEDSE